MTTPKSDHRYEPDYALAPGDTLSEVLAERGMSQAELARRTGLSTKHVNQIVLGAAPITAETALRLERVTAVPARVWTNLEADYQVAQTQREEADRFESAIAWLQTIPVDELVRRGWIRRGSDGVERLREVLSFFKVATPEAWEQVWAVPTAYRRSRAYETDYGALAAWIRIGELRSERLELAEFDRSGFREALSEVRKLTRITDPHSWLPHLEGILSDVGVAVVIEKEIKGSRVNGTVRWLANGHPLLQLSLRHRWADIFWFTFFHEAGHLLLHDRKRLTFVDTPDKPSIDNAMETEADDFAARTLIPHSFDQEISRARTSADVRRIADAIEVHPGIVVGRLQHDGLIGYHQLNGLRVRFVFSDD